MHLYTLAICLLITLISAPLQAVETARSLANQIIKQHAAQVDTSRGVTVLRTGSILANGKTQDLSVTVQWKAGMIRCDEITGALPAMTAQDSADLARADSLWKQSRKGANRDARDRRPPRAPRAVESRILVKNGQGAGWTSISARGKLPSAEFGWEDVAASNWFSPDAIASGNLKGEERVRGRDCWVVDNKGEGMFDLVWIDKESLQLVRAVKKSRRSDFRIECSDFRPVEGLTALPFKTELFVNGESTVNLTTSQASAGVQLWDGLFDPANIDLPAGHNTSISKFRTN